MKAQEILNKIKNVVGVELSEEVSVQLEELKLENGTILVAESFEAGKAVFIKSEEEEIALPVGEYALEDGRKLMVKEEGLIDAIAEAKEEEEEVEAKEVETDLEEEKEEMYVTKEEFALAVEEIKSMIEKIGDKEEMSEETEVEETEVEEKVEKEELSADVAEPIKHNPEKEDKKFNFKISNKIETKMDRIYNRLNNN
jgi:hypothetical protein|tara:strand:+ start:1541 stop:2134 length:594 start_codon:yes stop_codon:yes gene_type:complete